MQPLNALDALAPAFTRTHQLLFQPFRIGRSWKLAASANVAFAGAFFMPWPLMLLLLPIPNQHRLLTALFLAVPTLLLLLLFYCGVRMQSVHFEMVVTRAKFIAPMWRRYGASCWPWVGLKAVIGTAVTLAATPLLIARGKQMILGFASFAAQIPKPDPALTPDPVAMQQAAFDQFGHFFALLLPFYVTILGLFLVLKLLSTLLEDFALPFAILDEVPMLEAIRRGAKVFAADPLQAILFLLTKFILTILGFVAQTVVSQIVLIPVMILALILGGIAGLIAAALGAGGQHHIGAIVVGAIVGYSLLIVVSFWTQIFTMGYLLTLLEAYAIYFLGGRYQKLGDYLEPPTYTYTPPPLLPQDDDDSGPSLPMDPALV